MSCRRIRLQNNISLNEIGVDSAGLGDGVGLKRGLTAYTVVNIVLPVKVGVD